MIATPEGETCPACGGRQARTVCRTSDRLYRTTAEIFSVVECVGCGLMRLFPWPQPEELRRYYPESYWFAGDGTAAGRLEELYRRWVLADHVRFVVRALLPLREEGPVLDVGCGGGLFARLLQERGFRALGLEVSARAAAVAWRQNGVPAACGILSGAPLAAGSCAGITMFHVLEHLYDPAAYLQAAHELLRPDGRLVVQVPNASCWQFLLFGENWNGIDVPRHLVNFRARDLEALLRHCGFEVVRRKFFSLRDNPAGLASTIAPGLDPMARRVRGPAEPPRTRLLKDALYGGLTLAALPFAVLEAACHAGSTVMIEARKLA
ncbi:MAG: class I SAM-dependent methyltransferase [Acidobacteria bacterium]|nr:class I SAM-dependent methyltransferase [Acidobacteriota bacterium]